MKFQSKSGVKNIWVKPNGKFQIVHKIKGKQCYFGTYDTLEDAIIAKEEFIKMGWKKEPNPMRYITKCPERGKMKYFIQRNSAECKGYFGSFETLEDAKRERDLLEQCNWDMDVLCDLSVGDYNE